MAIDFCYISKIEINSYEDIFIELIETTCRELNIKDNLELSCIIVNEAEIQDINKQYRNIDSVTDVISFAMEDLETVYIHEDDCRCLGDIFICYQKALSQAVEYGHSLLREMAFLFTHGLLHLLGYDHDIEENEKIMQDLEKRILDAAKIHR